MHINLHTARQLLKEFDELHNLFDIANDKRKTNKKNLIYQ